MTKTKIDYSLDFSTINFREHPELYRIGRSEQGVLSVEPYKSEILPHWRFKTPDIARQSAAKIYELYLKYKADDDFVGMDMARKFLQMGYTRARRYANYKGGKKYDGPVPENRRGQSGAWGRDVLPRQNDQVKAESAEIFRAKWRAVREDPEYLARKKRHRELYDPPREPKPPSRRSTVKRAGSKT